MSFDYDPDPTLLEGRNLLITGATGGIGSALAHSCAAHGANLILLGRSQDKLEALYDEIEERSPGRVTLHPLDLAKAGSADYEQLASSIAEQFPVLDGLVHNAGVLGSRSPLQYYPLKEWDEAIDVNVNATFYLTRALLPSMQDSEDGRILFTSSSVGRKGRAYWGAYAVSKFAVEGMMETLSEELENTSKIRVNSINPGATRTDMRRAAYPAEDPNKLPTPEELMPVYLYLLGPEAAWLTGRKLDVRGFDPEALRESEQD